MTSATAPFSATASKFDAVPAGAFPRPRIPSTRFSISKPAWVVRTESNVHKEAMRRPHPSCVICRGSGRVDCRYCQGRGRTNCVDQTMLPKGEWPKWCNTCGGSGLDYCSRCLGTGEYRDIMGFHFMKMNANRTENHPQNEATK